MANNRCLIIGNGPSLNDIPDDLLKGYPSFGSNRIYLRGGFTPTYYAAVNPLVIDQFHEEIDEMKCDFKYIRRSHMHLVKGSIPLTSHSRPRFSVDPLRWVCEGWTVTHVLLQLALWQGYKEVGLVGVDHRYTYNGRAGKSLISTGDDVNHFSKDYFGVGVKWHAPGLAKSEQYYRAARPFYMQRGGRIVNLTPNSALDVFEKGEWQSWLI